MPSYPSPARKGLLGYRLRYRSHISSQPRTSVRGSISLLPTWMGVDSPMANLAKGATFLPSSREVFFNRAAPVPAVSSAPTYPAQRLPFYHTDRNRNYLPFHVAAPILLFTGGEPAFHALRGRHQPTPKSPRSFAPLDALSLLAAPSQFPGNSPTLFFSFTWPDPNRSQILP